MRPGARPGDALPVTPTEESPMNRRSAPLALLTLLCCATAAFAQNPAQVLDGPKIIERIQIPMSRLSQLVKGQEQ